MVFSRKGFPRKNLCLVFDLDLHYLLTARKHEGMRGEPLPQNSNRLSLPRKDTSAQGRQQRVDEAVVAKHPPIES
jgi:hypothetical protein